ncbi:MAG: DUF934 domain-containing protein [Pseudomonadales bacterium]|nr:DUF934 domain-containing protein [Pseudomonadales bacterium]
MTRLIRDNHIVIDDWVLVSLEQGDSEPPPGKLIVPLATWLDRQTELIARNEPLAVWLASDQHPEAIADSLPHLSMVAINFPVFSDGRGYSSARILREQYGFSGELRAIGDVLRDQLFLMRRCGFDSFQIRADRDPEQALASLGDFRHVYQFCTMNPGNPLLQRT